MIGIYKIECSENSNVYVGSSVNIEKRWSRHKDDLKHNKHHCLYLQRAWNKYGELCFTFSVVCSVLNKEDLIPIEQHFIDEETCLFNSLLTANSSLGHRWSECQKQAQSERMKGGVIPENVRQKMGLSGSQHHATTLTDDVVISIIERVRSGESQADIGREFNLTRTTINDMVKRRSWKHLDIPIVTNIRNRTCSKLTDKQVKEIKRLFKQGKSTTEISKQFSVGFSTIADIRKNKTWQQI